MMPEETVQAHLEPRGKVLLPFHWGQFSLSLHGWTEPIERLLAAADRKGAVVATPMIAQPITSGGTLPADDWWRQPESVVTGAKGPAGLVSP
ncbi:hypothetical protein DESUT3_02320 [Desulfuromonas versatilis]|uniref:Metallo-beta-lactamase domain-containing protein n=2 Tax=Desulfuromonas versatilis TaxID=2802975 RepID=A0ABN6DSI7_9BACT|nr:hypothetical protein DESUT3_02320 [Desulfuromonas versatilis]